MLWEAFIDLVTFDQQLKHEEQAQWLSRGTEFQGEGLADAKALRWACVWSISGTARRPAGMD